MRLQRGDYQAARDHFERAHELAIALGDTHILSNVVSNLGLIASYEGNAPEAEAFRVIAVSSTIPPGASVQDPAS